MSDAMESKPLNINTVLLTLVLAIGGWTLSRVVSLGEAIATGAERDAAVALAVHDLHSRLALVEALTQANQIALARLTSNTTGLK